MVESWLEQRKQAGEVEHTHPVAKRAGAVVKPGCSQLSGSGEKRAGDHFPVEVSNEDERRGQSQLGLEDETSESEAGEEFALSAQGEEGER